MALQVFKLFFVFLVLCSNSVFAAKLLIVTDQPSQKRANEIKSLILSMEPFSLIKDLSVVVRQLPKEAVVCRSPLVEPMKTDTESTKTQAPPIPNSCKKMFAQAANMNAQSSKEKQEAMQAQQQVEAAQRLVACDAGQALVDISGQENADRTIFVKDSNQWAGAGGSSITITITTLLPPGGAIHELLHSFGFGDEYEYASPCEADTYCPYAEAGEWANLAVLEDRSPYSSDADARQKHSSKIPWYSKIKKGTLITTGKNLGTPQKNQIGLHSIKVCDMAEKKITSWRPGSQPTIMEELQAVYIPQSYWPKIAQSLNTTLDSPGSAVAKGASKRKETRSEKGVQ